MKNEKKRWLMIGALRIDNLCLGSIYIWSIFNRPLMEKMNWPISKISLAYSLMMLITLCFNLLSGPLQKKIGHRKVMLFSVIFWSLGWFLTGFASNIVQLYFFFSFMVGIGAGFGYNTIVSIIPLWFPDKLGIANGMAIGASGLAPLIFAPIAHYILESVGVQRAFNILGIIFLILMGTTSWLITAPSKGWKPEGWVMTSISAKESSLENKTTKEMLKEPVFYMFWFVLLAAVTSGMMMTGHAAGIGESIGMTTSQSTMLVGLLAVMNFVGRIGFGYLSDKIGRYRVITIILFVTSVSMLMLGYTNTISQFLVLFSLIGLSFGAIMAVYPALCAECFGTEHMASNWAVLYSGYTAASFVGPVSAASCLEATGNYGIAFLLAGGLGILALVTFKFAQRMIFNEKILLEENEKNL